MSLTTLNPPLMEGISLVQDFAVILLVAGVAGWVTRRIGLSAVVGYLLAGIVIGPHTPPFAFVTDLDRIQTASQLGLVFLMFFVGLNLSLDRIRRLGVPVLAATVVTASIVYNLSQLFAWGVGWNNLQSLLFAAALMASSSAIITQVLAENRLTHEPFARNALGLTVLEDVVAVIMLTLIGSRLGTDMGGQAALSHTLLLLLGFVGVLMVGGLVLIPRLFERVGRAADSDLKSILVSGLLFAAGVAAVRAGFSIALGAFLFGVVVAESRFKAAIERRLAGAQDMFSAMFFVAIGMLIDLSGIAQHIPLILAIAAFAIVARTLAAAFAFVLTGSEPKVAIAAALTVTPIGEFSYIIAQIGVAAAVFDASFYLIAVAVSIVTAVLAPLLARHAMPLASFIDARQPAPMRRFLKRYREWLRMAGNRYRQNEVWRTCKRRAGLLAIELFLLVGLLGFSLPIESAIHNLLARAGYQIAWESVYWSIITLVALILAAAIWRGILSLSGTMADSFAGEGRRAVPLRRAVRRILTSIGTVLLLLLIVSLLPIPTVVPWIPLVVILVFVPLGIFFWQRIVKLHGRFHRTLERAVEPGRQGIAASAGVQEGGSVEEWNVELSEVVLPDQSIHAGVPIAELGLRPRFGCSIVEIERQGTVVSNPRSDFVLYPEDRLLLFGSPAQVAGAMPFLSEEGTSPREESDFAETILETLSVPPGSPHTGRTLAELQLSRVTGVQIMGIERVEGRLLGPGGGETLRDGDRLLVLGSQSELRELRAWLTGGG